MNELEMHAVMGEALVSRGLATAEQVAADRASLEARLNRETPPADPAVTMPAEPQAKASGAQTSAQLAPGSIPLAPQAQPDPLDMAIFAPPDSPSGYVFDRLPADIPHDMEQEQQFRTVCHEAGIAAPIAAQVDRLWTQALLNPPTPQQMEQAQQQTHLQLNRTFGDQAGKVIEVAQREFAAMVAKQPWLKDAAQASGLGDNYYAIVSLWNTARARGRA
jgi:hypothetical protein